MNFNVCSVFPEVLRKFARFLKNRCTCGYLQVYWLFYIVFRNVNEFDDIFVFFVSAVLFLYFS